MNNIGQNKRGLRLARLYKHRGLISVQFFQVYVNLFENGIYEATKSPCLLYGLDFVADKGRYFAKL